MDLHRAADCLTLMTIRIVQVNYLKLAKGVDVRDPDKIDLDDFKSDKDA